MVGTEERFAYSSPPIEEALVQFTFPAPINWTIATPGLVYQAFRGDYPLDPEQQEGVEASFQLEAQAGPANWSVQRGPTRVIYRDSTATKLVVFSSTTLSVNSLRPYEGWPSLSGRLNSAWLGFSEVGYQSPISQVSIRYINRITVPTGESVDLGDYFTTEIRGSAASDSVLTGFLSRVESYIRDTETKVTTTLGSADSPATTSTSESNFLLDIEIFRQSPRQEGFSYDEAYAVAEELKVIENAEFESSITDRCRELFNAK